MAKENQEKKVKKQKKEHAKTKEKAEAKTGRKLSKEEKQILFIIGIMAVAVVSFFLFLFLYKNIGVFVYEGIRFQKTNYNGMILYHGRVGMKTAAGTFNYNLYLRNDPRKLADIPANISALLRRTGYISFQPAISKCYGSSLAAYEIASFLSALGMQVKGATTSHEVAIDEGIDERDCADAINKTIIVLQSANETSIGQRGDCYILNISNCRVIETSESFMLAILKSLWNIMAS